MFNFGCSSEEIKTDYFSLIELDIRRIWCDFVRIKFIQTNFACA